MKRWTTDINGKSLTGMIEKINGTLWVHLNGRTFSFRPEEKSFGAGGGGRVQDPSVVLAPMPGKVVKLQCEVGDAVVKGQVLVSMEAMKMEYALKAERDGVVKTLGCSAGEQVDLGTVLVALKEDDV